MQRLTLNTLDALNHLDFDDVIDVRAPSEYDEDHIPGAVNLPVLDDDERARVGTVYTRESRFLARRMGAALIARNASRHLQGYLADKPADYRPLVYCWRGGQRSAAFALILGQIGWQVGIVAGGWRSYRRLVSRALYDDPFPAPLMVLDGNTGTAKTAILHAVARHGVQVIDLEGLARHRGSLFGLEPGAVQPSQKGFESALAMAMTRLDPVRPVLVEAESNRIGALRLPPALWHAMQRAPRLMIEAPLDARARWLAQAYADLTGDPARLHEPIAALAAFHSRERIAAWHALADEGAFESLAAALMDHHYDPRYARARGRWGSDRLTTFETTTLDADARERLADAIAAHLG
ncbi:MAG: tRNA 2-selenouridine synthase [Rhodobacteraceae bacterium HLUCCA12]|nr:MAG: tRNA 2-selenouridine synthase [Rhodobacteraceae bacterium HLUCCA12]